MIKIKIDKKSYRGVYSWSDLTLQKFCQLSAIPMPEGYEAFIMADGKFSVDNINQYVDAISSITDKQINEEFPIYYRKVIECLTNIPYKKVALMPIENVNQLYDYYFKPFVVSILYHAPVIHFMGQIKPYKPERFKSFRIGLRKFYVPETVNIMDQEIPLAKEPIITYTEASDIFRGMKITKDDVQRLGLFMSIYCRRKGEKYDERKALERQSMFMKVPMSIVWSVFFYTLRRLPDSTWIILLFGKLPKTAAETVLAARDYRNLTVTASSMSLPVMPG
jgi:hypothetical protein